MTQAELLGRHTHRAKNGFRVHIWKRSGKYLARGRYDNAPYGVQLGVLEDDAEAELRNLLHEIETNIFKRPSENHKSPFKSGCIPELGIRGLCNEFLFNKRRKLGKKSTVDYQNRLVPLIEFAEQTETHRHWPLAQDVDREFAEEFRRFLNRRIVMRNGCVGGTPKPISQGQIYNVLSNARTLFNWGKGTSIYLLPVNFVNPFSQEIVGQRPCKNPLRTDELPIDRRIALVKEMDVWQLLSFVIPFVLPLRPEDYSGLLISDVDFERRMLSFGSRFGGGDFNKGKMEFCVPFPKEIGPLFCSSIGSRISGPLLRSRAVISGRQIPDNTTKSLEELETHFNERLLSSSPEDVQAPQDRKRIFRILLKEMGGVSQDNLGKEFKKLQEQARFDKKVRFYRLREATTTDLERAGVSHLVMRFVTGHTTSDILNTYTSLTEDYLQEEINKHFDRIGDLLEAFIRQARILGIEEISHA